MTNPINPHFDPRITSSHATLNGKQYHYLLSTPQNFKETIFLIHGWPDLSIGWRNQIPPLLSAGYRIVAPDLMGFGLTDAPPCTPGSDSPTATPDNIKYYSFKRAADDIAALARQLGCPRIILGGHDWGGAVVYRVALWYPELISAIFAICTPYNAPSSKKVDLEQMVKTVLPNFAYQLHLASGETEKQIVTKEQIRQFLNGMYGGRGPNGEIGFDVRKGPLYENLPKLGPSPLLSGELLDWYAERYARNGVHGGLNWYRTRDVNFEDERELVAQNRKTLQMPLLFIQATKDHALPPAMSRGMEEFCPNMTRGEVTTGHWALWEAPEEVNRMVRGFLEGLDLEGGKGEGGRSSL